MKVLIFEFICGGGCLAFPKFGEPAGSLFAEGRKMLEAIVEEFELAGGWETVIPIDNRCAFLAEDSLFSNSTIIHSADDLDKLLRESAIACDKLVLIAPEIDNVLWRITSQVEDQSKLLCPGANVVELCSDKWLTYQQLNRAAVATPGTFRLQDTYSDISSLNTVIKPRFGAGGVGVRVVEAKTFLNATAASSLLDGHARKHQMDSYDFLLQEFVAGIPASIATWRSNQADFVFPAVSQCFQPDSFAYSHSDGPLSSDVQKRAEKVMQDVINCLPPFTGYLGIDLILGENADRPIDWVVDINPRLTTSFCQTRKMIAPGTIARLLRAECFKG